MGHFKVKKITDLNTITDDTEFPESDFATLTQTGKFVQLEYIENVERSEKIKVKEGIFKINHNNQIGFFLEKTSFTVDKILDEYVRTVEIENAVDVFFNNIEIYKEFGIEVPKRNIMLYGPGGTGKSTSITKVCNRYVKEGKVAVVIWHTSVYDPSDVKILVQRFDYTEIEKLILVVEDLGGVEAGESKINSSSSLLALLDNSEKAFTVPTVILATTNFPEMFLGNILDRPGRFDDKIKVGYPESEARVQLLKFFTKNQASEEALKEIADKKYERFSPAHLRESFIRSRLKSKNLVDVLKEMLDEQKKYNKAFSESGSLGL